MANVLGKLQEQRKRLGREIKEAEIYLNTLKTNKLNLTKTIDGIRGQYELTKTN